MRRVCGLQHKSLCAVACCPVMRLFATWLRASKVHGACWTWLPLASQCRPAPLPPFAIPLPPTAIDNFDCKPAECVLDLTLRLQGSGAGRVDLLEQAILQLCEAL